MIRRARRMRRLALLGAFLAPVSCELSSAYLYDYAFHKSTQEALDYNLNVLWKMGEVMATGMATDLVYNASGPGDLHGRLRSGDGTLSLLVYSLLIGESLATYMHYAGFEDSTWVGVYNAGNGGGPAGNYTFAVAANVRRIVVGVGPRAAVLIQGRAARGVGLRRRIG